MRNGTLGKLGRNIVYSARCHLSNFIGKTTKIPPPFIELFLALAYFCLSTYELSKKTEREGWFQMRN